MSFVTDFVAKILPPSNAPAQRQKASVTRPAVKKIVADALAPLCEEIDRENAKRDRKITKASEQATAAAEDAAAAREAVERLVETARETLLRNCLRRTTGIWRNISASNRLILRMETRNRHLNRKSVSYRHVALLKMRLAKVSTRRGSRMQMKSKVQTKPNVAYQK